MHKASAVVALIVGAFAVLAVGSYATADSGKKNVSVGPDERVSRGSSLRSRLELRDRFLRGDDRRRSLGDQLQADVRTDLEAPVLFAHIHFGQRSVNGGVAAFLCGGGSKPACPQSGTVTGTIVPTDVIGPVGQGIAAGEFDELVAAIRAGRAYANVHSTKFPGGEVRGQINDDNQRDD